jgi:CheY-like chemotaxis protein
MPSILMIDDDSLRDALRRNVRNAGYAVVEVNEGGQGPQRVESGSIYLVLLDMFMPGKEGLETITECCRQRPSFRVIAMSSGGSRRMMDESVCWSAGLLSWGGVMGDSPAARRPGVTRPERNGFMECSSLPRELSYGVVTGPVTTGACPGSFGSRAARAG